MTIFYLDIECDDLRGTTLLQVACISEDNKIFNGFCDINHILPDRCTRLTGFFCYKDLLFQHGIQLDTRPKKFILKQFKQWLQANSEDQTCIISHNGFGYDFRILLKHYALCGLDFALNVHFCDSLVTIKRLFKQDLPGFSLATLAEHYKIHNDMIHNGLSDSITLKRICDHIIKLKQLEPDHFIKNFKLQVDFLPKIKHGSPASP